jgi:hypothetical protein
MDEHSRTVKLTTEEMAEVMKPVNGQGGMEDLLRELQPRISSDGTLVLSPAEIERIGRYAGGYGKGGFQSRFKIILAHLGP